MQEGRGLVGPAGTERSGTEGPVLDKLVEVAADMADYTSVGMNLGAAGNHSGTCLVEVVGRDPHAS